jgi:L,D-peptidoglycan transpeptidase YkuD (ErfK/YbiS/YcfS/YnhG family)
MASCFPDHVVGPAGGASPSRAELLASADEYQQVPAMRFLLIGLISLFPLHVQASELASDVRQLIIGVAPGWDSSSGNMQLFERRGKNWQAVSEVIPVLFGRDGLAWGRGVHEEQDGRKKLERDGRAPAGLFVIGKIYGYDPQLPEGADYPYHQVTLADAWIDDVNSPDYNRHVRIDPKNPPAWFEKQKMRHNDFAYHWLVEIRHNSDPPVPGAGSAIFFHIRRGVTRPSAGCTTMARVDLIKMIRWLRADKDPHYVLLPRHEYVRKWRDWGLPAPEQAQQVLR